MKKLLLIAILMLALVFTVVACTTEPTTNETTAGETTATPAPAETTAEPADETTAAAPADTTAEPAPADTTDEPDPVVTTEAPVETTEPEPETTADPADPVWIIDAEGLSAMSGANNATGELKEGYVSLTATGGDPYFYPVAVNGNIGAMPEYLVLCYRTNTTQQGEFFIGNGAAPEGGKSFKFDYNANGEWNLLVFHLPTLATWMTDGTVGHIRYDFYTDGAEEGAFLDVEYVAFFNTAEYAEAYHFAKHPAYVDKEAAGMTAHSFDTFKVNGEMYFEQDGGAGDKLSAINNTVTFDVDAYPASVTLRGWIGFSQPIEAFGYYIDNPYAQTFGEFKTATEDAVIGIAGEHATRFEINADTTGLSAGAHTVGYLVKLADGTVVRLREAIKIVNVPYTVDETVALATGHGAPFSGAPNNYFGQRFNVGDKILKQVTITDLATYSDGNVNTWTFKVWQWNTDYATTTSAAPLFEANGENHTDNSSFVMNIPAACLISGDIYYEITYVTGGGCFTGWTADNVTEGIETYVAGNLTGGSYSASIVVGTPGEKPEKETQFTVVFGEIYADEDKGTAFDGNLYIEKNLGPAYFDGVRTGDWMEFTVNVEVAGDYNLSMIFGWLDATGTYTILVDGEEAATLQNEVSGTDWRAWTDSSSVKINLTEGEHTVRVAMGSDGPNLYGVKFAYVEPQE